MLCHDRVVSVMAVSAIAFPLLQTGPTVAAPGAKQLSFEQAFSARPGPPRDDEAGEGGILGRLPQLRGWLDDDSYLEIRIDPSDNQRRLFKVDAASGQASVHCDYAALQKVLPEGFDIRQPSASTADLSGFVFDRDNDLYFFETTGRKIRRLTANPGSEHNPSFSPDGKWLAYTRGNDLFAFDLVNGVEHRLTRDGSETIKNGYASWVYYEEILGRRLDHAALWWSPDSTRLAFIRFDDAPVPAFPIYHADGQHGELEMQRYPKAGDPNPLVQVGVVAVESGKPVFMDFDPRADHYLAFPSWTPDAKRLIVQWMNRGQDIIRLFACDPTTGKKTEIFEERQPAWVEFFEDLRQLKNGQGFLLRSNVDGWDHLYLHGSDGTLKKRLTSGNWSVGEIEVVDEAGGWVFFIGSPGNSWDAQLMKVRLDGTGLQVITPDPGVHRVQVSPSGRYFIDTVSSIERPDRMRLFRGDLSLVRELGDRRTPAMDEYAWGKAELFTIPSDDKRFNLPVVWVLPPDFDPARQYPVLISIYGGPASPMVHNAWLGLQSHYWAERGVITVRVDHRGSGHFGKKGAALMHRNLGKWEVADYKAAADWLRTKPFVAKNRIGITGGSYGGYVTLMAMTAGAPHFNFGLASASVSDWQLYDSVYTERFMDLPTENPEGYRNAAVLTWIDRYSSGLRITHGTIDDNVHLQNSLQVVDWLTSHNKPFELMLYPDSRHGFQPSQRPHSLRETHDFWVRTLLEGKAPLAPQLPVPRREK